MTTEIAATQPFNLAALADPSDLLWDAGAFAHAQRIGKMFADSKLVPEHLRGNVADCTIALLMARQLGEAPLVVLQSIYIVKGKAGWSAQYVIGRANRSGVFTGRINWRVSGAGPTLSVTAFAVLVDTGEEVSFTATMAMAIADGWAKNEKYQSIPELMLRYRSAVLLVRLYCPEIMLGLPTEDEIPDGPPVHRGPPAIVLDDDRPPTADAPANQSPAPSGGDLRDPGRLGALGLGRGRPAAAEGGGAQGTAAAQPADHEDAAAVLAAWPTGLAAWPIASAQAALKEAREIGRLDGRRWTSCVEAGHQAGWWTVDGASLVRVAAKPAAPAELSGQALLDAVLELEAQIGDGERLALIAADHLSGPPEKSSDPQLRGYLAALRDAAGA